MHPVPSVNAGSNHAIDFLSYRIPFCKHIFYSKLQKSEVTNLISQRIFVAHYRPINHTESLSDLKYVFKPSIFN